MDATITFNNSDYNNFDLRTYLSKVDFTYTRDKFIIKGDWDAQAYYAINNPSTDAINSTFSSMIYDDSSKIGDLRFKDDNGGRKLFVYYKDGTSDNTSIDYNSFLTSLKAILRPYFGEEVDSWF